MSTRLSRKQLTALTAIANAWPRGKYRHEFTPRAQASTVHSLVRIGLVVMDYERPNYWPVYRVTDKGVAELVSRGL